MVLISGGYVSIRVQAVPLRVQAVSLRIQAVKGRPWQEVRVQIFTNYMSISHCLITGNRLRQPKERRQTPIYIRIPSLIHRHSRVSDASATLRHLTGQLEAISERLQQLQNLIDANEEDLRKKQENLNKLVVDIEEKAVDELRMQQRVQLLEKCFCLMQKQRNGRL